MDYKAVAQLLGDVRKMVEILNVLTTKINIIEQRLNQIEKVEPPDNFNNKNSCDQIDLKELYQSSPVPLQQIEPDNNEWHKVERKRK